MNFIEKIPTHIGFIMDGNGRWAKKRGQVRTMGHRRGAEIIKSVVDRCFERGIKAVSLYAFSTENFNRPKDEVDYIFALCDEYLIKYAEDLKKRECRVEVMGDLSRLPQPFQDHLKRVINESKNYDKNVLNIGLAYGGRSEIVHAVNTLISSGKKSVTEQDITGALYTSRLPDLDLIVRASGEQRLSNFMLWQAAYAEFYFPKTLWPDFNARMVDKCIKEYNKRDRRFGKV